MQGSEQELYFEHLKGQAQFAYFQLGVAASAIAYAVHETNGRSLRNTPWLIGAAVLLWAVSFAVGCFGLEARQRAMLTNLQYLNAIRGVNTAAITDAALKAAFDKMTATTQKDHDRPWPRFRAQMITLFLGALAYIGGHVMQMASTPPSAGISAAAKKGP